MLAKMRAPQDGGSRIGIVFNGSPLFTGDAGSGESNIRQWIIENDWLEAVVALPDQLFYNTGISTYLWVLTNRKEPRRKGQVQLIDARRFFVKMPKSLGNKRHKIGDPADRASEPDQIGDITRLFGNFQDGESRTFIEEDPITRQPVERMRVVSKVFANADFGFHKITPWPRSAMTSGSAMPSTTASRHFWKLERKKQVREVMAPIRPPGRSSSSPRSTKIASRSFLLRG